MEFLHRIYCYLIFHRRIIFGALLIVGLVYFLMVGRHQLIRLFPSRDQRAGGATDRQPAKVEESTIPGREATGNEDSPPRLNADILSDSQTSMDDSAAAEIGSESELLSDFSNLGRAETTLPASLRSPTDTNRSLIESDQIDNMIERALESKMKALEFSPPVSFMMFDDQRKLFSELLERELTATQKKFAISGLLESLSLMDSINHQAGLRVESTKSELFAATEPYLNDSDPDIRSLACIARIFSHGTRFLEDATLEQLQETETLINEHFDEITSPIYQRKLATLVSMVSKSVALHDESQAFASRCLARFLSSANPETIIVGRLLEQSIHFNQYELSDLVDRMERNPVETDQIINNFFASLEKYPDAAIEIQQNALDVIREYIRLNKKKRAHSLIEQYEQEILMQIQDTKLKGKIEQAVNELKGYL